MQSADIITFKNPLFQRPKRKNSVDDPSSVSGTSKRPSLERAIAREQSLAKRKSPDQSDQQDTFTKEKSDEHNPSAPPLYLANEDTWEGLGLDETQLKKLERQKTQWINREAFKLAEALEKCTLNQELPEESVSFKKSKLEQED